MKTSNYIIISFLIFLFSLILLLFLSGKYRPWELEKKELKTHEINIDDFSVIVASNHSNIRMTEAMENNKIAMQFPATDSIPKIPDYTVQNDTLFITKTFGHIPPVIHCKKVSTVIAKGRSLIKISKFPIDTLDVSLSSGKFYYSGLKHKGNVELIRIKAQKNSYVQFNQSRVKNLEIELDQTKMNTHNTIISSIEGIVKNQSDLNCYKSIGRINLDIDGSSTYNLDKRVKISGAYGLKAEVKKGSKKNN